ncbi:FAD-linked oxidase C-terminal domain-containing protein [Bauldia litoralis]|uniref:Glycolate oxidase n=1 Tax=Bauldia litoralis TaxID=665467 RepID=A0A1G6CN81_9HYPH|nr:FAD-linked oxidase C-terminal domain-containing protein [Bauldia litoralis]SDB34272.1 glycolate oxidase [Bauldia litoralis]
MTHIAMPAIDEAVIGRRDEIVAGLVAILGAEHVIATEDERRAYETDALTAYRAVPLAVVLPGSTEEVSKVLAFLNGTGAKVIARGAGTSLSGGALPSEDAVVLGLARLNRIVDIDYANRVARVQTGVTNVNITNAVAGQGFFYAPDPSSQLACTIGGNIAMNSGGAHCLKYGVTTNNILGLRMVMLDGTIVDIGGSECDAAGYDLLGLVIGSEGQLGVVTEATVRILRAAEGARPMLMGFDSAESAGACVAAIIGSGIIPVAIEYMDRPAIKVCEAFAHAGYPLDVEALLIIEVEGSEAEIADLIARITGIAEAFKPSTLRISQSATESAAIWKGRKSAFGAMGRIADYMCMDGVIPTSRLPEVLSRITAICEGYGLAVANIFHAGDGNLHPLVLYDMNDPDQLEKAELAGGDILKVCVEVGGCLTGEHGVGIEKRELMSEQFTQVDLDQQMQVKSVFDPGWKLNPAKVFPLEGRPAVSA